MARIQQASATPLILGRVVEGVGTDLADHIRHIWSRPHESDIGL